MTRPPRDGIRAASAAPAVSDVGGAVTVVATALLRWKALLKAWTVVP